MRILKINYANGEKFMGQFDKINTNENKKENIKDFLENLEDLSRNKSKIDSFLQNYVDNKNKGEERKTKSGDTIIDKKLEDYSLESSEKFILINNKICLVSVQEKYSDNYPGSDPASFRNNPGRGRGGIFLVIKYKGELLAADPQEGEKYYATLDGGSSGNDGFDVPNLVNATLKDDGVVIFNQLRGWKADDIYERSIDLKKIKFNGEDYKSLLKKIN